MKRNTDYVFLVVTAYNALSVLTVSEAKNGAKFVRRTAPHMTAASLNDKPKCVPLNSVTQGGTLFTSANMVDVDGALECTHCTYVDTVGAARTDTGIAIVRKKFDCPKTWLKLLSQCPAVEWPPPRTIPNDLFDAFTMRGTATVEQWYFQERYSGRDALANDWSALGLDARVNARTAADSVNDLATYTVDSALYVDSVLQRYADFINGSVGLVWGSEKPWAEILLARRGATATLTVEYGRVHSTHASIHATTPQHFAAFMLQHAKKFDFAFTYSSLEHSGLGRYGDLLNPYGDIEAASQTWCALRPGGLFFLGVPAGDSRASQDKVVWNAHRLYGPERLAQMFAGYEYVDMHVNTNEQFRHFVHVVYVLRKPATALDC